MRSARCVATAWRWRRCWSGGAAATGLLHWRLAVETPRLEQLRHPLTAQAETLRVRLGATVTRKTALDQDARALAALRGSGSIARLTQALDGALNDKVWFDTLHYSRTEELLKAPLPLAAAIRHARNPRIAPGERGAGTANVATRAPRRHRWPGARSRRAEHLSGRPLDQPRAGRCAFPEAAQQLAQPLATDQSWSRSRSPRPWRLREQNHDGADGENTGALPACQLHLIGAGLPLVLAAGLWTYGLRAPLAQLRTVRAEQQRLEAAGADPRLLAAQLAQLDADILAVSTRMGLGAAHPAPARMLVTLMGDVNRWHWHMASR